MVVAVFVVVGGGVVLHKVLVKLFYLISFETKTVGYSLM